MSKKKELDYFCFQRICELLEADGEKKEPYQVFWVIIENMLHSNPTAEKYFGEFYQFLKQKYPLDAELQKKTNKNDQNNTVDKFLKRNTKKSTTKIMSMLQEALAKYLLLNQNNNQVQLNLQHFEVMKNAVLRACEEKSADQVVQSLLLYNDQFGLGVNAQEELFKMRDTEPITALTWLVIISLTECEFAKANFEQSIAAPTDWQESKKLAYDDCLKRTAAKWNLDADRMNTDLHFYVIGNSLRPGCELPNGEDMLELMWKFADMQKSNSEIKAKTCKLGIQYAKSLNNGRIEAAIYPYVLDFYIDYFYYLRLNNHCDEQYKYLLEAQELENIRRNNVWEFDNSAQDGCRVNENKTDGVSIRSKLQKAAALFYSRYRVLTECHKYDSDALDCVRHEDLTRWEELHKTKLFNNRAIIYRKQFNMDKAISWYQSALITRLKFKEEIPNLVALAQTNLGIAYTLVHDYHSANQLLKDALEVRRRLKKEKPEDFAEKVSISAYSLASYYISQSACVNGLRFDKVLLEKSWAEEIAALLAESWETFDQKDCTPQKMSANQQNVLFNHRMIEAVYLFTLGKLSETARECATRTAAVKQLGVKTGQEDLYIAAFYLFSQAESLIEELKKDESENLKFNKISCGDRRYGIFSVNAVLGKLLVSDALKDDSKDILAEYHTIISYVSNLNQDASLAAEQTLIAVIAFYGEFIMLHPDLADQQKLKALMRKAKKLIDKLSKYGEKTVKALEPALKSIQHCQSVFFPSEKQSDQIDQNSGIELLPYLMMQL